MRTLVTRDEATAADRRTERTKERRNHPAVLRSRRISARTREQWGKPQGDGMMDTLIEAANTKKTPRGRRLRRPRGGCSHRIGGGERHTAHGDDKGLTGKRNGHARQYRVRFYRQGSASGTDRIDRRE
mmetsp:Transcript_26570/g.62434  ORF Transcript_26570/g.62434 Transcript_26570/m.62434 type:complete len:128 (+) Transcript_26570:909-1292(+)